MKKLAVAIGLILASQAASAAEVYNKDGNKLDMYGSARVRHYFSDLKAVDGDQSYVRFGFKGQTQITNQLTGYGQWEYNIQANHTEANGDANIGTKTRLGFAGLKYGKFGSLDYGRNWGIMYDVAAFTDIAPIFDDLTYAIPDNYMTGRANGVLTYRNTNFFGLVDGWNFGLQYQGKNAADSNNGVSGSTVRPVGKNNGDGFGLSSSYAFGKSGITAVAGYANSDRTFEQERQAYGKGSKAEIWGTALKYDANGVYLAAMYSETHNLTPVGTTNAGGPASAIGGATISGAVNKTQNFEVIAAYLFDFGLRPQLGYFQSKGKDLESNIGDADLAKYIDVNATYFFNKNMNVYIDYKINLLETTTNKIDTSGNGAGHFNKVGVSTDNILGINLQYQF